MSQEFNPDRSIFGKHKFLTEQMIIFNAYNDIQKGVFVLEPDILKMRNPIVGLVPMEKRRELAKKHFGNALKHLRELGV